MGGFVHSHSRRSELVFCWDARAIDDLFDAWLATRRAIQHSHFVPDIPSLVYGGRLRIEFG